MKAIGVMPTIKATDMAKADDAKRVLRKALLINCANKTADNIKQVKNDIPTIYM